MPAVGVLKGAVADVPFPYCVKPVHLGSSIGVARVENLEELSAVLPRIFALDSVAMIEPFVPNLAEFNVAVAAFGGALRLSAIERPKRTAELLDFRQKYASAPGKNSAKAAGDTSQGMLALTRDINPHLPEATNIDIKRWATSAFNLIDGTGCPRFDFLCNESTGDYWLNEINPCPGSFGYFLWEAASEPIFFTMLINLLIEEAINCRDSYRLPTDPVPVEARLFQRH
jgi:D-alanine-D-alanine ligase